MRIIAKECGVEKKLKYMSYKNRLCILLHLTIAIFIITRTMSAETNTSGEFFRFHTNRVNRLAQRLERRRIAPLVSDGRSAVEDHYGLSYANSEPQVSENGLGSKPVVYGFHTDRPEEGGLTERGQRFVRRTVELFNRTHQSDASQVDISVKVGEQDGYSRLMRRMIRNSR